ncbi:putative calcium-binding protein CML19 [Curcuma longa]|uniref:putative calcium-binding protein CML19 n=1 Tax=Curcuma longa TaxID=136217 RepID=UPI003D9E6C44
MDLHAIFLSMDEDGDGKISAAELALCVANAGLELSLEDAKTFIGDDEFLDFEGFAKLAEAAPGEVRDGDLRAAFTMYEQEGQGCITPVSLQRMLSRLGECRDVDECHNMICRFDLDGDGVLSFEEFRIMMTV